MFKQKPGNLSTARKEYLRRQKRDKASVIAIQWMILIVFFAIWEIAARLGWIDSFLTSQPSRMWNTLKSLCRDGQIFMHVGVTCLETIIGFLLGTVFGTLTAILLWWSPYLNRIMEPYLIVFNSLPKIALGPIFIIWIGAGPQAIVVMALTISLIVTILEVLHGFQSVDEDKIKLVETFGGNKLTVLRKVVLPANIPSIVSALKVNVGLSWVGVIAGEFLVSRAGIGYLIVYGGQVFQLDLVMTGVIILAIAAALMYQGVVLFEKFLLRRRDGR